MLSLAPLLCLALAAPCARVQGGPAFVEVKTPADTYFVHQPIELTLRFGLERAFLERDAVSPFHRPLDVPAQVEAPWLDDLSGSVSSGPPPQDDAAPGVTFSLDGQVARATQVADRRVGERTYSVFEVRRVHRATRSGDLRIPPARLHTARATGFREDFTGERVPDGMEELVFESPQLVLTISPLPEEGRPLDFSGAIGDFTLTAATSTRVVRVGESFRLTLTLEGPGNLALLGELPVHEVRGFHVNGRTIERGDDRLSLTYDLSPLSDETQRVPALSMPYFDPAPPGAYRVALAEPLPLGVRPARFTPEAREPEGREQETPRGSRTWPLLLAIPGIVFVVFHLRRRLRQTRGD